MNPGPPPGPGLVHRAPPARRRQPTLVRDVDLRDPLPDIAGGVVTRALLVIRVGGVAVGRLLLAVPEKGLDARQVGQAVASRVGAVRRRAAPSRDGQPRSRSRGRMSLE
jgi:hypothetical protein